MHDDYPDIRETTELINKMEMLPNIREHSYVVKDVCEIIFNNLKNKGNLDIMLIKTSAMLHDITKSRSIKTGESHSATGAELLMKMGYPAVAEIISSHVQLDSVNIDTFLNAIEIVHYADKRVKHDKVVTLKERINDIIERYGKTDEIKSQILNRLSILELLEQKIRLNLIRDIEPDLFRLNEK